ncbi:tetratricopeptide repeat protein [Aeromonas veronii]|uniref:Sel1 repeat family protein n=1 Tax=Aeromonas veronii TaxID=654 RepID=A0A2T4MWY1_AERVE|nr:tetratricopeptide repeat protein [Aeromonas veronii]PTH79089.1 hypothetical protein DAA48_21870 [Aeromonas veronii]
MDHNDKKIIRLAKKGDAKSQFLIASEMFFTGAEPLKKNNEIVGWIEGTRSCFVGKEPRKDNSEVVEWLEKSSNGGLVEAKNLLGMLYMHGEGVKKQVRKGLALVVEAARLGFSEAQYNLALIHLRGFGVKKSPENAVYWLKKDEDKRELDSTYLLGCMYFAGYGVEKDKYLAASLINRAIRYGFDDKWGVLEYILEDIAYEYNNGYEVNESDSDLDCVLNAMNELEFYFR